MEAASTPTKAALSAATVTPLAQLSPSIENPKSRYFRAVIVLLWPFSSSTKQLSLLLSEPDFRLRGSKGQVKVKFCGASAENIAKSKLGIGDTVFLSLDGAKWKERDAKIGTPGECIDWDLRYNGRLLLEICRDSQVLDTVDIDTQDAEPGKATVTTTPTSTPPPTSKFGRLESLSTKAWASPVFSRSIRTSFGSLSGSAFDPLAEEDGFIPGKGRKRTRFGRPSGEWTFVNTPPSPTQDTDEWHVEDDMEIDDLDDLEDQEIIEPSQGDTIPLSQSTAHLESMTQDDEDISTKEAPKLVLQTENLETTVPQFQLEPESNVDHAAVQTQETAIAADLSDRLAESETALQVPPTALRRFEGLGSVDSMLQPAETPRLRPLMSPGIPIVSPLESSLGGGNSYFHTAHSSFQSSTQATSDSLRYVDRGDSTTQSITGQVEPTYPPLNQDGLDRDGQLTQDNETPAATQKPVVDTAQHVESSEYVLVSASQTADVAPGEQVLASQGAAEVNTSPAEAEAAILEQDQPSPDVEEADHVSGAGGPEMVEQGIEGEVSEIEDGLEGVVSDVEEIEQVERQIGEESESDIEPYTDEEMSDDELENEFLSGSESVFGGCDEASDPNPEVNVARYPIVSTGTREVIVLDSSDEESEAGEIPVPNDAGLPVTETEAVPADTHEPPSDKYEEDVLASGDGVGITGAVEQLQSVPEDSDMEEPPPNPDAIGNHEHHEISLELASEYSGGRRSPSMSSTSAVETEPVLKVESSFPGTPDDQPSSLGDGPELSTGSDITRRTDTGLMLDGASDALSYRYEETRIEMFHSSEASVFTPDNTRNSLSIQHGLAHIQPQFALPTPETSQQTQFIRTGSDALSMSMNDQIPAADVTTSFSDQFTVSHSPDIRDIPPVLADHSAALAEEPSVTDETKQEYWVDGTAERGDNEQVTRRSAKMHERAGSETSVAQPSLQSPGLRTSLSYFPPLSRLAENFDKRVDTISVIIYSSKITQSAKRPWHYFVTLFITDPSMSGSPTSAVLFRPHKKSLPSVSTGDVILLRNFQVQTVDHRMMLKSTNESAWAVFIEDRDGARVQMNGPPLEHGEEEQNYAAELRKWFYEGGGVDLALMHHQPTAPDLESVEASSVASSEDGSLAGKEADEEPQQQQRQQEEEEKDQKYTNIFQQFARPKKSKSRRRITSGSVEEVAAATSSAAAESSSPPPSTDRGSTETSSIASSETGSLQGRRPTNVFQQFARPKKKPKKKHRRRITIHELRDGKRYTEVGSPSDQESIHELRDGTVYTHL
ncbi:hypothetical protein AJ80_01118 [Polytolypa hystricis UAMH7299]|uniref:Telomeric single stranded DNA binding POT1/Cdc13 domain-containing protein n=1 Tax=Polytolypa hystricis (strain UAMH7299) TaxID=1447883 RepID=A0A2B7Z1F7_POLH7|nr:hypothetical protein AJ80_01118 [Polytolypa hystricis UAMH7299]